MGSVGSSVVSVGSVGSGVGFAVEGSGVDGSDVVGFAVVGS